MKDGKQILTHGAPTPDDCPLAHPVNRPALQMQWSWPAGYWPATVRHSESDAAYTTAGLRPQAVIIGEVTRSPVSPAAR
jgi:hypothetical protein